MDIMNTTRKTVMLYSLSAFLVVLCYAAICLSGVLRFGAAIVWGVVLIAAYACLWFPACKKVVYPALLIAMAFSMECIMQLQIKHRFSLSVSYQRILDFLLYCLIFAVFFCLFRHKSTGLTVGIGFFMMLSTLNLVVTVFRGKPVYFPDIYSAKTALDVASGYSFPLSKIHIVCTVMSASLILLCFVMRKCSEDLNPPIFQRLIRTGALLLIPVLIVLLRIPTLMHLRGYYFSTTEYWLYSFSMSAYQMRIIPPSEYTPDAIPIETTDTAIPTDPDNYPNVLFIMNEAFADLRVISSFNGDDSVMPFFDSMAALPTVGKGNLHTSIYGGNTANTEFEVLTGVSMYHLPYDTTAYNLYLNSETHSLAGYFSDLGYQTVAFHPSAATNYNRIHVYPNLGFQKAFFQEDYDDLDTLRTFTSDGSNYEKVIGFFEEKPKDKPLFLFNVTVQNHGPFDMEDSNFERKVLLDDPALSVTEQYLSCLKYSDEALQQLLTYLEDYPEPVAVVFFGDHQAKIDDAFYESLFGKSIQELSEEEAAMRFIVPYMIWTNYGLQLEDDVSMSANYLGAYLIEQLGLPQTEYHAFLNNLRSHYPIVTVHGITDAKNDLAADAHALMTYENICYNMLFDRDDPWDDIFTLAPSP